MRQSFQCVGDEYCTLWHCFGNIGHHAPLEVILGLLEASGTNVLPVNTHNLDTRSGRRGLQLGFSDVSLEEFRSAKDLKGMVTMLNINHRTSAERAVETARIAVELTGEVVIKLEVLNPDLKTSNDGALIQAAEKLIAWKQDLKILPLVSCDPSAARRLIQAGCPLLRVMGSSIGSCSGIGDEDGLARIIQMGVPVIVDGGLGTVGHARRAVELGAAGVLINSMLFSGPGSPASIMRDFVSEFFEAARTNPSDLH